MDTLAGSIVLFLSDDLVDSLEEGSEYESVDDSQGFVIIKFHQSLEMLRARQLVKGLFAIDDLVF